MDQYSYLFYYLFTRTGSHTTKYKNQRDNLPIDHV